MAAKKPVDFEIGDYVCRKGSSKTYYLITDVEDGEVWTRQGKVKGKIALCRPVMDWNGFDFSSYPDNYVYRYSFGDIKKADSASFKSTKSRLIKQITTIEDTLKRIEDLEKLALDGEKLKLTQVATSLDEDPEIAA